MSDTFGFSIALISRSVIFGASWLKTECTLAITISICASTSSERSRSPSARMSTSIPAKILMPSIFFVGFANALDVLDGALVVEAVGEGQILGVIGDGHVFVAARLRGLGHLLDGVAAIGLDRVHVHIALQVGLRDQAGQGMVLRPDRSRPGSRASPAECSRA